MRIHKSHKAGIPGLKGSGSEPYPVQRPTPSLGQSEPTPPGNSDAQPAHSLSWSFASGRRRGFSALPAGNRNNNGSWNNQGNNANFWSATEIVSPRVEYSCEKARLAAFEGEQSAAIDWVTRGWNRNLNYNNANLNANNNNKTNGFSARCLQNW